MFVLTPRHTSSAHIVRVTRAFTALTPYRGVSLLGLCEERNSSFQPGVGAAPEVILNELRCDSSNSYCEYGIDTSMYLKHLGDWSPGDPNTEDMVPVLTGLLNTVDSQRRLPLVLGGDHSISYPVIKALQSMDPTNPLVIVHFDAHPDLYPLFQDNLSSHASPFARIMEQSPPLCSKLIQIGIRTINDVQKQQLDRFQVVAVEAQKFPAHGNPASIYRL
jgi:arginase